MENKVIYILGCGGHARSVADVILDNNPSQRLVFVDKNARENETILTFPVIKSLPAEAEAVFVAIGDNAKRRKLAEGKKLINVISKRAYVSSSAKLADGIFVGDGAHIGPLVQIGCGTIINTNAVIEHEDVIDDWTHVSVNATICGHVRVGKEVFLGAGSVVKDGIAICDNVTIGAGGIVIKNIGEKGIYVGVPTRRIK